MPTKPKPKKKTLPLDEAKAECRRRVQKSYQVLEANVDRKYRTSSSYQNCILIVLSDMVREGIIREDQRSAVGDQSFG